MSPPGEQDAEVAIAAGSLSPPGDRPPAPYSAFTRAEKWLVVGVLSFAGMVSPLSASVYISLLTVIRDSFGVGDQAVNLSLTLYVVFQALGPTVFAPPSQLLGRRPVLLAVFTIYAAASLGLALNASSFAGLLALRVLQSIGASAVVPIGAGVINDLFAPQERGPKAGIMHGMSNVGPCIGPVAGAAVVYGRNGDFAWSFWFLAAFGAAALASVAFLLPETSRDLVGNGDRPVPGWIYTPWWALLAGPWPRQRSGASSERPSAASAEGTSVRAAFDKVDLLMPVRCLGDVLHKDVFPAVWMTALAPSVYFANQALIPRVFAAYGWGVILIGCAFIPGGAGAVVAFFANGQVMRFNVRRTARERGLAHLLDTDDPSFPIEEARARDSWAVIGLCGGLLVGYGWAVQQRAHPAVLLVLQFLMGWAFTYPYQVYVQHMTDVFPENPSAASAANTTFRYLVNGVTVALLDPMVKAMDYGWYFTLFGILTAVTYWAATWLILTNGRRWRLERRERLGLPTSGPSDPSRGRIVADTAVPNSAPNNVSSSPLSRVQAEAQTDARAENNGGDSDDSKQSE